MMNAQGSDVDKEKSTKQEPCRGSSEVLHIGMVEDSENLVLELLRTLRSDIAELRTEQSAKIDKLSGEVREIKERVYALELQFAILRVDVTRINTRLDSIEKHLNLQPA